MELTPDVIEGFTNACLIKNYDTATEIPSFHKELWGYCCSKEQFVAIAAPREHGKSTAVTHAYLLAELLFRNARYALIVSDSFSQACQFLGEITKELLDNEDIHNLFGKPTFEKQTEDIIIVRFDDGYNFRVEALGAEQSPRGLKWDHLRPDLIICDDMENDELVMNKDRREKFRRQFFGALMRAKATHGRIRIVGTILHLDSLLERLMPEQQLAIGGSSRLKHLVTEPLKQWADFKTAWKSVKYRAHSDDFKSILWPTRHTKAKLQETRLQYEQQGLLDVYSQEMLNIPLDESNSFFRKADFLPIRPEDRKKNLNYYIAADLAISQKQRADWSVFAIAGMDEDNQLQCINIVRQRMDAREIVDTIISLQKIYNPEIFGIEAGIIEKAIGPYLNEIMMQTGVFVRLEKLKPSGDKLSRARSIQARMRAGAVKFDKEAEWYYTFEEELIRFPRDRHDDQVDAWAYIGLMLDSMQQADTQKQAEEYEYHMDLQEAGLDLAGRSQVTGY